MPALAHSIPRADVQRHIELLICNLVDIKDASGEFLLKLADGRIIDTKGWNDWEWTHGIGLYGIWKFYESSADPRVLQIITNWFRDRFATGTPTKNVNTMSPILTGPAHPLPYQPQLESGVQLCRYSGRCHRSATLLASPGHAGTQRKRYSTTE